MTESPVRAMLAERDETGWLIEENASGVIHWIALVENVWKYGWYISESAQPSPVRRVKDSNDALRFARQQDAEAFIKLFDRFLLCATPTEHEWPRASPQQPFAPAPQTPQR